MYIAIKEVQIEEGLPIELLCNEVGVARSSYYKWLKRQPTEEEWLNHDLLEEIKNLHKKRKGILGYRRILLYINRMFGKSFNHKRIYRLMKLAGIKSVIRKKRKRYPNSTPQHIAENVLNREFKASKPNKKWVTDVTEFKYGKTSKAYLSAIRDLFDGSIVSYVIGHSNNNSLVFETLERALRAEPGAKPVFHSDRGFQYTSPSFKAMLDKADITQSMSRVGRCIDNSPMESFWGALKCEEFYLNTYQSFGELKQAIDDYIAFYNQDRLQERLNGLSPLNTGLKPHKSILLISIVYLTGGSSPVPLVVEIAAKRAFFRKAGSGFGALTLSNASSGFS